MKMNKASCTMLAFIFLFIPSRLEDKLSNDVEVLMLQSFAWDRRSAFYTWVWEIGALEYRLHLLINTYLIHLFMLSQPNLIGRCIKIPPVETKSFFRLVLYVRIK